MALLWSEQFKQKLIHPSELEAAVKRIKATGKRLATLNGSFDLLHAGHLQIIFEASKAADLLLVALNSDDSIRQYKSLKRPIIPLEYRLQIMAALEFVDYVTWFDETDPRALLEAVKPHVHVNGSEYGVNCIEADVVTKHGGEIQIVSLLPGLSTSAVIEKIKSL